MSFKQYDFAWTAKVGERTLTDGDEATVRMGPTGDLLTNVVGRYYELARKARIFMATTAVAGVAPGTAIGTTAAAALYNPASSGKDLVVLKASLSFVSGTLGLGQVDWIAHTDPAQTAFSGTAMTVVSARLDSGSAKGQPATTVTVPTGGSVFRFLASLPPLVGTSVVAPWRVDDDVDGAIVIPPGCGVSLQATAAGGSTPKVRYALMWAEVPATE